LAGDSALTAIKVIGHGSLLSAVVAFASVSAGLMGSIVRVGAQAFFPESFRQNSMNLPAGDGRHQRPDGTAAAGGNGPD